MLIGISGNLGSGKTSVLTYLAFRNFAAGLKVFSNYRLNFGAGHGKVLPFNPQDLAEGRWQGPGVIAADELQAWLESRVSTSVYNRLSTQMVIQTRKKDTHFMFTTPSFDLVDIRIRRLLDVAIHCEKRKDYTYLEIAQMGREGSVQKKLYLPPLYGLFDTKEIVEPVRNITHKKEKQAQATTRRPNVAVPT